MTIWLRFLGNFLVLPRQFSKIKTNGELEKDSKADMFIYKFVYEFINSKVKLDT